MIASILLEVGSLGGLVFVFMMFLIFGGAAFLLSIFLAFIIQVIYENKYKEKLKRGQFWLIVFVCLSVCGIIAGAICF